MTDKQIIIDENICEYYSDTKEDEEGANPIVGWCNDNYCKCEDVPLDECVIKAVQVCKLKDKQLKAKEQECKKSVMLKCPQCGVVYLNPMGCELYEENEKLKAENKKLKKALKNFLACPKWCDDATVPDTVKSGFEAPENYSEQIVYNMSVSLNRILEAEQQISECEVEDEET